MAKSKSNSSSYEKVERSIRQKKFSPIYLLYGEEDFLIDAIVDLIIEQAIDESTKGFNLDVIQGGDVDAKDVVSIASAFPMMSDYRVVVVNDIDKIMNKELLIPYLENPLPSTLLVLTVDKPDFRVKLYKSFEKNAILIEAKQLSDYKIPSWIEHRISSQGKEATAESCQLIHTHVGNSLRELRNEIDKLFIFVGDKHLIDVDDVNAVVGTSKRYNIFELQKAIGKQDLANAQEILERMLDTGEYAVGLITMLTRYFQKLWIIWDFLERKISRDELIQFLRLSPKQIPFLEQEIEIAKRYTSHTLELCFSVLLETDEKLKSSSQNERLILTMMLYKIIRGEDTIVAKPIS